MTCKKRFLMYSLILLSLLLYLCFTYESFDITKGGKIVFVGADNVRLAELKGEFFRNRIVFVIISTTILACTIETITSLLRNKKKNNE